MFAAHSVVIYWKVCRLHFWEICWIYWQKALYYDCCGWSWSRTLGRQSTDIMVTTLYNQLVISLVSAASAVD